MASPEAFQLCCALLRVISQDQPDLIGPVSKIMRRLNPRRHGPGFSSVQWDGQLYSFTAAQGAVVELLWDATDDGCPEVKQELLLDAAGSDGRRLVYIFRDHPAWGIMIVPGNKGTFRLAR